MLYTPRLNLKKPQSNEAININDINDNMDILDAKVGSVQEYSVLEYRNDINGKPQSSNIEFVNWNYRVMSNGQAEMWAEVKYKAVSVGDWYGGALYEGELQAPGQYPIKFKKNPMVFIQWVETTGISCPIFPWREGWTTTGTGVVQIIDPSPNHVWNNCTIGLRIFGEVNINDYKQY